MLQALLFLLISGKRLNIRRGVNLVFRIVWREGRPMWRAATGAAWALGQGCTHYGPTQPDLQPHQPPAGRGHCLHSKGGKLRLRETHSLEPRHMPGRGGPPAAQGSIPSGPLPPPAGPPQGPECPFSLSWDLGPTGELTAGSAGSGWQGGRTHPAAEASLLWSVESRAACRVRAGFKVQRSRSGASPSGYVCPHAGLRVLLEAQQVRPGSGGLSPAVRPEGGAAPSCRASRRGRKVGTKPAVPAWFWDRTRLPGRPHSPDPQGPNPRPLPRREGWQVGGSPTGARPSPAKARAPTPCCAGQASGRVSPLPTVQPVEFLLHQPHSVVPAQVPPPPGSPHRLLPVRECGPLPPGAPSTGPGLQHSLCGSVFRPRVPRAFRAHPAPGPGQ